MIRFFALAFTVLALARGRDLMVFSDEMTTAIKENFDRGEQTLVLLNR
jgi:primosomal protein N'